MDEAEQFDRLALIHKGKFIRTGTSEEIKKSIPGEVLEVLCDSPPKARNILKILTFIDDIELFGDKIHIFIDKIDNEKIAKSGKPLQNPGLPSETHLKSPTRLRMFSYG